MNVFVQQVLNKSSSLLVQLLLLLLGLGSILFRNSLP